MQAFSKDDLVKDLRDLGLKDGENTNKSGFVLGH